MIYPKFLSCGYYSSYYHELYMGLSFVFCLIFSISLLEKFRVSKRFSVVKWRLRGSSLLLLFKEHCFAKKKLKSLTFFSWNLLHTHFRGKEVEWVVYFYYSKTFLIMSNKLLYFSVYELIYKLFENKTRQLNNSCVKNIVFRFWFFLVASNLFLNYYLLLTLFEYGIKRRSSYLQ